MTIKKNRKTYTAEFEAEALKLAERVVVAEAPCSRRFTTPRFITGVML